MKARPRRLLISLLVVLFIGLAVAAGAFLYHADYLKTLLLQQIEQQLGRPIEVDKVRLVLLPRLKLDLSRVVVRDQDPTRVLFSADRLQLILRPLPLLRQQVVGRRLTIDQPQLVVRRNSSGHWNVAAGGAGAESMGNPLQVLLMVRETVIRNGGITVIDEFRADGPRHLRLAAVDATVSVGLQGTQADVGLSATIQSPQGVSAVSLVGSVSQAPASLTTTQPSGDAGPRVQFEGNAEALNIDISQVADFFGPRPVPTRLQGSANFRGHIRLVPGVAGYDMVLSDMTANVEGLRLSGQASLSGLLATQPTFAATFSSSPLKLEDFLNRFPVDAINPDILKIIEDRQIGGTVEVINATLTGSAVPEPHFSITGEFRIAEGRALLGQDRIEARNLSGTVFLEPGRVRLTELSGEYGPLHVSGGKGLVTFAETPPKLELEVTGDMSAEDLTSLLARKVPMAALAKTFSGLKDVKGNNVLTFRFAGALDGAAGLEFLGGEFVMQDVSFQSPTVPDPVAGLTGRVLISNQGVELDKVSGRLGKSRFELDGLLTLGQQSQFQDFTVQAKLNLEQWTRLFPALSDVGLRGDVETNVELSGRLDQPRIKAAVNLQSAHLDIPGWVQKTAGIPGAWNFEGTLAPGSVFNVEHLELTVPPFRLEGKGKLRLSSKLAFQAVLVSGPIAMNGLPQGFSFFGLEGGSVEVSLDLRGTGTDWHAWRMNGWVALTDAVLVHKALDAPLTNVYLRLKLLRNGADLKRLALRFQGNDLSLSGTIRNWHQTPLIDLKLDSSQFDLERLIPKGERSPTRDFLERLATRTRVSAAVALDRGMYKQVPLKDVSARISIRDGVVEVERLTAAAEGGTLAGRFVVRLPEKGPAEAETVVRLAQFPFARLAHLFGTKEHPIVGTLGLSSTLQGHGKNPRGVLPTLNGTVDLLIEHGRILKLTVMSKILTIMNLPVLLQGKVNLAKDGMPFDKISGTFTISNGIVASKNIIVDSPVMKMSGAGKYNLTADQLDFVLAVSPFGSYSEFIRSIPLFGKLFAGERKGIDTALFEVKGPLNDPRVAYLPLRSFATGLTGLAQLAFDVLKNAVLLPKDLIEGEDEKAPAPPKPGEAPIEAPPSNPAQESLPPPPAPAAPSPSPAPVPP